MSCLNWMLIPNFVVVGTEVPVLGVLWRSKQQAALIRRAAGLLVRCLDC
jgi:hypothetical protein